MAAYRQLVAPRKNTQAGIGWCLAFAQSFFGAPVKHASAWEAWQATVRKQTGPRYISLGHTSPALLTAWQSDSASCR